MFHSRLLLSSISLALGLAVSHAHASNPMDPDSAYAQTKAQSKQVYSNALAACKPVKPKKANTACKKKATADYKTQQASDKAAYLKSKEQYDAARKCTQCGSVIFVNTIQKPVAPANPAQPGLGKTVGGMLGAKIGGGSGQQIAQTLGQVVGEQVDNQLNNQTVTTVSVKLNDGSTQQFEYTGTTAPFKVGDAIKVENKQLLAQ